MRCGMRRATVRLLLLVLLLAHAGGGREAEPPQPQTQPEPSFDPSTPLNVTALVGKSARLTCRVRNLGNRTVSWVRHRDIHILTVGGYTYTSDQRFEASHDAARREWSLHIRWAQRRDAGIYECQLSTQPVRSLFVHLSVVDDPGASVSPPRMNDEPRRDDELSWRRFVHDSRSPVPTAVILGGPDIYVNKGSTINLTCTIRNPPEPPAYIFWYHHDKVISYDSARGGVSVITDKGEVTTSYLLVQDAHPRDSGDYSCRPSNADVARVTVHVLHGERPQAMQTAAGAAGSGWRLLALLLAVALAGRAF
ncbi:basement membrane-specific heparan sulfate proteoglycan core protein-like isoform X1 [Schistocerca nitens]|uniref:basement membrane-specific heparan sulfate proteoglycan core protein-like isoform X1 n=1 Tax=Schistocerca nitens TaxID=7011 RepID=UPI002119A02D|nr:basement membrane-specific heparan sulfate proteoglycan core protein-like isoform X1 [Schistocerca nitens]